MEVGRCELKGVFVTRCSWCRERGVIHCRILQCCCGKSSCTLGKIGYWLVINLAASYGRKSNSRQSKVTESRFADLLNLRKRTEDQN